MSEAVVVGLLAGVAMGLVGQSLSGTMGVVGSLYGVAAPLLGWTVHLFHSVVFAIVAAMAWHHESLQRYVGTPVGPSRPVRRTAWCCGSSPGAY